MAKPWQVHSEGRMTKRCLGVVALLALLSLPAAAQDAKTVISNASKAMGAESLSSITYYGSGANFVTRTAC